MQNADINTSLINDINNNSSIHSLVFNVGFSLNSSPNIRRSKYFNNLSMNYDNSIDINFAQSNEISNDGLFQSILKNERDNSFQLNKFNLNDNTSNIIANNPDPELNLIKFNKAKVMEKILLNKELNLIKKEKELNKKEKDIHARTEGLSIKEKDVATRAKELSIKEKDVATRAKELNHLITELTELKDHPKIVMEKIKKLKLMDVENEDEKENLTQKAIFTENNIDEKKKSKK